MDNNFYEQIIRDRDLSKFSIVESINIIASFIDHSIEMENITKIGIAIDLINKMHSIDLPNEYRTLLYYFEGNVWNEIRKDACKKNNKILVWEQKEFYEEVICYRKALGSEGFHALNVYHKCRILTNIGNSLMYIGRFIEAIEYFNKALEVKSDFGMAYANRGQALRTYSCVEENPLYRGIFIRKAYNDYKKALDLPLEYDGVREGIKQSFYQLYRYYQIILEENVDLDRYQVADNEDEEKYRVWCLNHCLFLNPINDIGPHKIASYDYNHITNVINSYSDIYFQGLLNQIKQEYVSARYLYYDGIIADKMHYSDIGVVLYDTMDFPLYSLSIEKIKISYRMLYSCLDKIAYFCCKYFDISTLDKPIYFKSFWYENKNKIRFLRPIFKNRINWPLRGLFWLSKDLFEDDFQETLEPEAKNIREIRNHLEHKYLKVHHNQLDKKPSSNNDQYILKDVLAFSINIDDFKKKTMHLLKLVRAAIMYLSYAIIIEERNKKSIIIKPTIPIYLNHLKDRLD